MTLRRTVALIAVGVLAGLLAGSALGRRATFKWVLAFERDRMENDLRSTVKTLAHLRNGDSEQAIQHLEAALDFQLTSLPQHTPWLELPGLLRHAFTLGKAYRTAYPPAEPNAELEHVLGVIPFPAQKNLPPELRSALEGASERQ
jgi:hypothetical protein